jgi:hypothetical protein
VLAMQEELNNFKRNEVWTLVPRPKQNVVGTKWVFRNKQDEHGVVTRNKARLVAKVLELALRCKLIQRGCVATQTGFLHEMAIAMLIWPLKGTVRGYL